MKLKNIKKKVYCLSCTENTSQLKKRYRNLVLGRDLRYKIHWQEILNQIKLSKEQNLDISLEDLEASEAMLKQSLTRVGHIMGLSDKEIKTDWQRIQLEAQFADIHIEEL